MAGIVDQVGRTELPQEARRATEAIPQAKANVPDESERCPGPVKEGVPAGLFRCDITFGPDGASTPIARKNDAIYGQHLRDYLRHELHDILAQGR